MSRKSCEVRKTLVRNTEQPLKPLNTRRSENLGSKENEKTEKSSRVRFNLPGRRTEPAKTSQNTSDGVNRFSKPELHTTLVMRQKMETAAKEKAEKINVDPSFVASSKEEINKKLNFNRFARVYKNLVPVNVNDVSLAEERERVSRKKKLVKTPKDPIPNPVDVMKPIPSFSIPRSFNTVPVTVKPLKMNHKEENHQPYMQNLQLMKHFGVLK